MMIWKKVPGFQAEASEAGELRSLNGAPIKSNANKHGYLTAWVRDDGGVRKRTRVGRLVCMAFHGPPPEGFHADHIDNMRTNDTPLNLRWLSPQDNRSRRALASGERHWNAKLSQADVLAIRSSVAPDSSLALLYGVNRRTIYDVRKSIQWAAA